MYTLLQQQPDQQVDAPFMCNHKLLWSFSQIVVFEMFTGTYRCTLSIAVTEVPRHPLPQETKFDSHLWSV
jgi:hypothetical protein